MIGKHGAGRRGVRRPGLRIAVLSAVAGGLALAQACSSAFSVVDEDLVVRADGDELELRNRGTAAVFYIVLEQEDAAVIDWMACVDPDTCPRVDPGMSLAIAYPDIIGYDPRDERALLYWWHLVENEEPPEGSEVPPAPYRPDGIRTIVVELE